MRISISGNRYAINADVQLALRFLGNTDAISLTSPPAGTYYSCFTGPAVQRRDPQGTWFEVEERITGGKAILVISWGS